MKAKPKPFEFTGYPQRVLGTLMEDGFLAKSEEGNLEAQKLAFGKWQEDRRIRGPICPSVEDSTREAECRICRDARWIYATLDPKQEDFGKAILCPECSEGREADDREQRRFAAMGIPDTHKRDDFSSFRHDVVGVGAAFKAATELAMGKANFSLLMIYGGVGNGKTHLGYAACLEAKERKRKVKWQPLGELFAELRQQMAQKEGDSEAVINELKNVDFLALDDMPTNYETDWQIARLAELIDYRYARELPTILTTNRDLKTKVDGSGRKIEALPEQILRRFREPGVGLTVLNAAPEYRKKRKELEGKA